MHFISFRVIISRIKAIRFMMRDRTVPKRKKLLVVAGIVYLLLPFDLIPPVLFPIAWIDDLIVWLWILWHLKDTLDAYWLGEKEVDLSGRYQGDRVIKDANFEVRKDPRR
ncbi:MAG: DUF1232 domain-containing protein [Clostridiales Family XIII bacterium]|jgi:uncharacterized membrane protein YkvA (DUF1232 family)|nr:DUF1232 domain-containing protein [Clostridiales Family XIII bacterium]